MQKNVFFWSSQRGYFVQKQELFGHHKVDNVPDWDAFYIRVRLIDTRGFFNFPNSSMRLVIELILWLNYYGIS